MASFIEVHRTLASGAVRTRQVPVLDYAIGSPVASAGVAAAIYLNGAFWTIDLTLTATLVTLVKNGTSTGGGGTKIFSFLPGLVNPCGGSSNLTVVNAGDKSFLASVGSAVADTGGTLTSTEISFLPQTAATTSGAGHDGTCKMKSTVTIPTPGLHLDGTSTPVDVYLNACLNADATGVEALTFAGTIRLNGVFHGDN